MRRTPLTGEELRLDRRAEKIVPQPLVDLGPGGAGIVPGTLAARLAEPVSQRRGRAARSFGIRTARAAAGPRLSERATACCGISTRIWPTRTPGATCTRRALHQNPVAYFSAEFGFHETLPIAAGGLGILAGDHAKSASDSASALSASGLFYREGYFQQAIDRTTGRRNITTRWIRRTCRWNRCWTRGRALMCSVEIGMSLVVLPGVARERRPGAGVSARHEPARKTNSISAI